MLKSQDVVIVIHLLNLIPNDWTQQQVAYELCMSQSEVSMAIKRLIKSQLMNPSFDSKNPKINISAVEELVLHGLKYIFPADTGSMTRGLPTAFAAPILKKHIISDNEQIPVWPCATGTARGYAFAPLYKSITEAIIKFNNQKLYDIMALIDALRSGRARERNIATKLLHKYFEEVKNACPRKTKF